MTAADDLLAATQRVVAEVTAGLSGLDLDDVLAQLATRPCDAVTGLVLQALPEQVGSDHQRETAFALLDRHARWVAERRAAAMVAAAEPQRRVASFVDGEREDLGREVVAALTGLSTTSAARELDTARLVTETAPGCRQLLATGALSWQQARESAGEMSRLAPDAQRTVDARMTEWASSRQQEGGDAVAAPLDAAAWRRRLRREVLRVDDEVEQRRELAVADRAVRFWALPDGMAAIEATLPAEQARVVLATLGALGVRLRESDREASRTARTTGVDSLDVRTLDQCRADALVALARQAFDDPDPLVRSTVRARATVAVTGGAHTLLGLADVPGELAGYGPISPGHLRSLAADAEWRRFVTDPHTGALTAIGTTRYRPTGALRDFLEARTPHCDFPGCAVSAARCDVEHTTPYGVGGCTDSVNLRPRCRRHHRCKTHTDWQVAVTAEGGAVWTTPGGLRVTVQPVDLAGDDPPDSWTDDATIATDTRPPPEPARTPPRTAADAGSPGKPEPPPF